MRHDDEGRRPSGERLLELLHGLEVGRLVGSSRTRKLAPAARSSARCALVRSPGGERVAAVGRRGRRRARTLRAVSWRRPTRAACGARTRRAASRPRCTRRAPGRSRRARRRGPAVVSRRTARARRGARGGASSSPSRSRRSPPARSPGAARGRGARGRKAPARRAARTTGRPWTKPTGGTELEPELPRLERLSGSGFRSSSRCDWRTLVAGAFVPRRSAPPDCSPSPAP